MIQLKHAPQKKSRKKTQFDCLWLPSRVTPASVPTKQVRSGEYHDIAVQDNHNTRTYEHIDPSPPIGRDVWMNVRERARECEQMTCYLCVQWKSLPSQPEIHGVSHRSNGLISLTIAFQGAVFHVCSPFLCCSSSSVVNYEQRVWS